MGGRVVIRLVGVERGDAGSGRKGKETCQAGAEGQVQVGADGRHLMERCRFPAVDLAQQMLLSPPEELVRELPPIRDDLPKTLDYQWETHKQSN